MYVIFVMLLLYFIYQSINQSINQSIKVLVDLIPLSNFRFQVMIYNPSLMHHIHTEWMEKHGRYPSTGNLAMFFALQICDEVRKNVLSILEMFTSYDFFPT